MQTRTFGHVLWLAMDLTCWARTAHVTDLIFKTDVAYRILIGQSIKFLFLQIYRVGKGLINGEGKFLEVR